MDIFNADINLRLTKDLYPTGRAFSIPKDSNLEKIHLALNDVEQEMIEEALGVLDSILPDNNNFTSEDAGDWERRLSILSSSATSLESRKSAISRKYGQPGNIEARSHYLYIQGQLRAAGFDDIYVFENNPNPVDPGSFPAFSNAEALQLGQFQLGQQNLGSARLNLIANFIDEDRDSQFSIGSDFRHVFFIGDQTLGDIYDIPSSRKDEFRQLVLNLKPTNTVAVIFINYT